MSKPIIVTHDGQRVVLDAEIAANLEIQHGQAVTAEQMIGYELAFLLAIQCKMDEMQRTPHEFRPTDSGKCNSCGLTQDSAVHTA